MTNFLRRSRASRPRSTRISTAPKFEQLERRSMLTAIGVQFSPVESTPDPNAAEVGSSGFESKEFGRDNSQQEASKGKGGDNGLVVWDIII